jgi:hypothetical protein
MATGDRSCHKTQPQTSYKSCSAEAFNDVRAVAGIEFDEEDVTAHKVTCEIQDFPSPEPFTFLQAESRMAALQILYAKGYR